MTAAERKVLRAVARSVRKREAVARRKIAGPNLGADTENAKGQALALAWVAEEIEQITDGRFAFESERHAAYKRWLMRAESDS